MQCTILASLRSEMGHKRQLPHRSIGVRLCSINRHNQSPPKVLEPIDGQLGIADGVLDVLMTEIMLERASIVAIVGELVAAGVPEHVRVDANWHLGGLTEALDEPVEAYIDLLTGQVHALVKDRHRSREFIEFLKLIDAAYPAHTAIRLILDNHSAHISKETKTWLA